MVTAINVLPFLAYLGVLTSPTEPESGDVVTVHIVPHTHDDVGWLKTIDEYYTGQNNSIQNAHVHMILDTVVRGLLEDPSRTFTYVEQAFFQRWWRQQGQTMKAKVRGLVSAGQLEFSNGGWVMHDEAAPFYMDMIDQTTLGHKFLAEEFGVCPKTGWQLDPFGHSSTQAALLSAEVGFEGLFFGRVDYQDLELRRRAKAAEFIWRASPSLGPSVQVFAGLTGEYGGNYGAPSGFDWDQGSSDEPVQDDKSLEDYNVKSRVDDFVKAAMEQAGETRGKHVMWTMGSDFEYTNAFTWFENLDRIIKYANLDGRVRARYSTPLQYVRAKQLEDVAWPLKTDDFFPYADGPHQFWSGYFTSRPAFKRYIRESGALLRTVQQLAVLSNSTSKKDVEAVQRLWDAQSTAQHHDGVSGTAKQHVTFDYAKRLSSGRAAAMEVAAASVAKLAGAPGVVTCDLLNVSVCAPTQSVGKDRNQVCFSLWNSLAHARREIVELPVSTDSVRVTFPSTGATVPSQLVPSLPSITNYGEPAGGAMHTLTFVAELPPVGFSSFCLASSKEPARMAQVVSPDSADPVILENDHVSVEFCGNSLCKITDKDTGIVLPAKQSWVWYNASDGDKVSAQASGAYIFRPVRNEAMPVFAGTPSLSLVRGAVADEVHQTFGPWISQRIRLSKDAHHVEITYTVGAIDVSDRFGKEVVSRITTGLKTKGECFMDSNGREMLRRKRDFRPSWTLNQTEPVAGNYYPVTTSLFIRDQQAQLTLLTDASQAGTGCIRDGELELIVHRRLLKDDGRGVGEPLNETEFVTPYVGTNQGQHYGPGLVTRGKHLLLLSRPAASAAAWRPLVDRLHMPVLPFFYGSAPSTTSYSAMKPLPPNLELVSLAYWSRSEVLIRLAHQFGIGEDAELSKSVSFDLQTLLTGRAISGLEERGLAATSTRRDVLKSRIAWKVEGEMPWPPAPTEAVSMIASFGPLQIRTFLLKFDSPTLESQAILI